MSESNSHNQPNDYTENNKGQRVKRTKFPALINTWNGLALICGIFAGIYWSSHIILSLIFSGFSISFVLITVHFELKEHYGTKYRFVATFVDIICWIGLIVTMLTIGLPAKELPDSSLHSSSTKAFIPIDTQKISIISDTSKSKKIKKKHAKPIITKRDSIPTIYAPNNQGAISINQQGGITAGTVNINSTPKPTYDLLPLGKNVFTIDSLKYKRLQKSHPKNFPMPSPDTFYTTESRLILHSEQAIAHITIVARSPSIFDIRLTQEQGRAMWFESNHGDGIYLVGINNPYGSYKIQMRTHSPEETIDVKCTSP